MARFLLSLAAKICLGWLGCGTAAWAEEPPPNLAELVGVVADVKLTTGFTQGSVEVVKVVPGTAPGAIRSLTVKPVDAPRQTILGAQLVTEILVKGVPLDVTYDKRTRELVHDPAKRTARLARDAKVLEQLRAKRARLWEEISDEDNANYVAEQKAFLQKAQETMGLPMQLLETRYYLFFTDMPLNTVGPYVAYLDQMYLNLTKAFDFPDGKIFPVAAELRRRNIPFVFVSGALLHEIPVMLRDVPFISKPYKVWQIAQNLPRLSLTS